MADRSGTAGRRRPRRLGSVLAVLAVAAATASAAGLMLSRHAATRAEAAARLAVPRLPVGVVTAELRHGYEVIRGFTGIVVPRRSLDVAFQIDGFVDTVLADLGDVVEAGAVMARLDVRRLEARRDQLQASLAEATATLDLAEREVARQTTLSDRGHASRQALDRARTEVATAAARRDALAAQLDAVRIDLADSRLEAPFTGTVTERMIERGAVVRAGTSVFRLLELGAPEARVGLPVAEAENLAVGDTVDVALRDRVLPARIRALVPEVQAGTRTVAAVLVLPDTARVAAGEVVELRIRRLIERAGFEVPTRALTAGPRGLWAVQVAVADGAGGHTVRRAAVEVLHVDGDRAFVSGSLAPGDLVVAEGTHRVAPGQPVRILAEAVVGR